MDSTISSFLRPPGSDIASPLEEASFPAFKSGTVQELVKVIETLADPEASTKSEDLGRQLRSLADEFAKQGLVAGFMGIMTERPGSLAISQQANDICLRLRNLAQRLNSTKEE